jgi:hypothetical protein
MILEKLVSFSSAGTLLHGYHEIKLTANSCIARCNSKNTVSILSARTTKRFPSSR